MHLFLCIFFFNFIWYHCPNTLYMVIAGSCIRGYRCAIWMCCTFLSSYLQVMNPPVLLSHIETEAPYRRASSFSSGYLSMWWWTPSRSRVVWLLRRSLCSSFLAGLDSSTSCKTAAIASRSLIFKRRSSMDQCYFIILK